MAAGRRPRRDRTADDLALPSGRSVPIDYAGEQPDAFVRVQDLFGVTTHPTAGGLPIRLHLLSPADRPIQVTADLPGFWAGSWADVKKDMAGPLPETPVARRPGERRPQTHEGSLMVGLSVGMAIACVAVVYVGATCRLRSASGSG